MRRMAIGVVLLDPGNDVLGVERNLIAETEVGRRLLLQQMNRAVEQKLQGGVGQCAQHPAELALAGQAAISVKAPGIAGGVSQCKAKQPNQGWMRHKIGAQVPHVGQSLIQLDEKRSGIGGAGLRLYSRPRTLRVAFGKMLPVQSAQQTPVVHGDRRVGDKGRQQRCIRRRQRWIGQRTRKRRLAARTSPLSRQTEGQVVCQHAPQSSQTSPFWSKM